MRTITLPNSSNLMYDRLQSLERGVFQPVQPLEASNWQRLATEMEMGTAMGAGAPGIAGPSGQVPPGSTGRIEDTPAYPGDTAPRPPSNIPASPSGVPGSPSPRGKVMDHHHPRKARFDVLRTFLIFIFSLIAIALVEQTFPNETLGGDKEAFPSNDPVYIVRFQGKDYHALYEQQINAGVPIDLYYYKIPPHKGVPAAQDGQDLWGRFVRVPSANDVDQSSVVWGHAWWTYENGRWLSHQAENVSPPEMLREAKGEVRENTRRGKLGVSVQDLTPDLMRDLRLTEGKGALVVDAESGGPAERAGIRRDDVIISYDGTLVMNAQHLAEMAGKTPAGKTVKVKIVRDGRERTLPVTIGPPGSATELPEKETKKPLKKDAPAKIPPKKETGKPDVPKEKKPPAGGPPKDLGEL